MGPIISEILWIHVFGVILMASPKYLTSLVLQYVNCKTDNAIFYSFLFITTASLLWPLITFRKRYLSALPKVIKTLLVTIFCRCSNFKDLALVCVIICVEFATALMCVAMHNFSLAMLVAVLYAPVVLAITPKKNPIRM